MLFEAASKPLNFRQYFSSQASGENNYRQPTQVGMSFKITYSVTWSGYRPPNWRHHSTLGSSMVARLKRVSPQYFSYCCSSRGVAEGTSNCAISPFRHAPDRGLIELEASTQILKKTHCIMCNDTSPISSNNRVGFL